MSRNTTLDLDAAILAARMRTHKSRPLRPVTPRGATQYLQKHAIADVWLPSDAPPIRSRLRTTADKQTIPAPQPVKNQAVSERVSTNPVEKIDFAKNAAAWKEAKSRKRPGYISSRLQNAKLMNYALVGMAGFVFLLGVVVALNSFKIDRQITATVSAQTATGPTASGNVNEAKPSSDDIGAYTVAADMPRYITVPALDVFARIRQAGTDNDGALEAPYNVHDAAWYTDSVKPGSPGGASIIDGHISGPTQRGVFYDLNRLKKGDVIIVERGDGKKISYKVVKVEIHDTEKVDMAKMFLPVIPGKHGLNLISCTGTYNSATNDYEQRVLVFAEAV